MAYCAAATVAAQYIHTPIQKIDLLFAGDIMQHETQLKAARTDKGTYSFSSYYKYVKEVIGAADIAIGNLETPIGKSGFSGYPSFSTRLYMPVLMSCFLQTTIVLTKASLQPCIHLK